MAIVPVALATLPLATLPLATLPLVALPPTAAPIADTRRDRPAPAVVSVPKRAAATAEARPATPPIADTRSRVRKDRVMRDRAQRDRVMKDPARSGTRGHGTRGHGTRGHGRAASRVRMAAPRAGISSRGRPGMQHPSGFPHPPNIVTSAIATRMRRAAPPMRRRAPSGSTAITPWRPPWAIPTAACAGCC
jgi:hypothetical protein